MWINSNLSEFSSEVHPWKCAKEDTSGADNLIIILNHCLIQNVRNMHAVGVNRKTWPDRCLPWVFETPNMDQES